MKYKLEFHFFYEAVISGSAEKALEMIAAKKARNGLKGKGSNVS